MRLDQALAATQRLILRRRTSLPGWSVTWGPKAPVPFLLATGD